MPLLKDEINKMRDINKKLEQEKTDINHELELSRDSISHLENELSNIKSSIKSSEQRKKEEIQHLIDNLNREKVCFVLL